MELNCDLDDQYLSIQLPITKISVQNRNFELQYHHCYFVHDFTSHAGERLAGAIIRIGSNSDRNNPVCGTITLAQVHANQNVELTCGLDGQYLSVELPIDERLQLCEVQAFEGTCTGRIMI